MSGSIRVVARVVGAAGLAGVAVLHAVWAAGSPWPARSSRELAEAVVGQAETTPGAAPTAVVAAGAAGASLLAAGALGDGKLQRAGLRIVGTGLLLRAILGGEAALAALGLPPAGERFRRLDRRCYRPFTAVTGLALWIAAKPPSESCSRNPRTPG